MIKHNNYIPTKERGRRLQITMTIAAVMRGFRGIIP